MSLFAAARRLLLGFALLTSFCLCTALSDLKTAGCLAWGESGGMGEGWGDYFATGSRRKFENTTDYSMGEWASSRKGGIRNYPYSTNLTTNLDSYTTLDKPGYWGVQ